MLISFFSCFLKTEPLSKPSVAESELFRSDRVDVLHGIDVSDPYQWMEEEEDQRRISWVQDRNLEFERYVNSLPSTQYLEQRFMQLWQYDDRSIPEPCLLSENKSIVWAKNKEEEKYRVLFVVDGVERTLLDPNIWNATQTLSGFYPSPDCSYFAYGIANAGDENPIIHVMDTEGRVLEDSLAGWKQRSVSWLHDNSGFFYASWPTADEGFDPNYYHSARFHKLGDSGESDIVILRDREVKEHFHGVGVSEDGRYLIQGRYSFNAAKHWIKPVDVTSEDWIEINPSMDANYEVYLAGDRLYILTDWQAPHYRIMTTTIDKPEQEHWTEFLASSNDIIRSIHLIAGYVFVDYQQNAHTIIKQFTAQGDFVREVSLPGIGKASISGLWRSKEVFLEYESFAAPSTSYRYDVKSGSLSLFKPSPIDIDLSSMHTEQVFYPSKDGTNISMSLIYPKGRTGTIPFLLTGYGGFNVSLLPRFSSLYAVWVEAGGGLAIPNLRGGGEYGQEWHKAGMREKKQNVFDDFIAAAEFLIQKGFTSSDQLGISGGSNGGLLVSAVAVQRPDLFRAVLCSVPLTDMIRYHLFGLANIWSEEYGNAEDAEQFSYLKAYSPYHNLKKGVDYPSMLVIGSANDARTDPVHALKFVAQARYTDIDHGQSQPIFLQVRSDSGHGGGVGIQTQAKQYAQSYAYVMNQLGLNPLQEKQ